ncbi:MAG: PEP-CTERM sorting domain-containing protein, partial [Planctomycetaceae bacterium]|nr:PEP-CTERM sorting domain-containing protein [Planctomycetaceae bacterium]
MRGSFPCSVLLFFGLASPGGAGMMTYTDYASWNHAVTNVTPVTIPDVTSYLGPASASVTFDGVTFATDGAFGDPHLFTVSTSITSTIPILSVQQGTQGLNVFLLTFPTPITAFSMNFGTFSRFSGINLIILSTQGRDFLLGTGDGYATGGFIGVVESTPFQTVHLVSSISDVINVGNVAYADAASVPEPGSLSLFGMGAIGMIGFFRRRRRAGEACQQPESDRSVDRAE